MKRMVNRMKRMSKRMLVMLLVLSVLFSLEIHPVMASSVSTNDVSQENTESEFIESEDPMEEDFSDEKLGLNNEDIVVKSTNSFGELLAEAINEKVDEEIENNGFNIFSIEVEGTQATVSFETLKNCTLIVGIYDETGSKLLATGNAEVAPGQEITNVKIVTSNMPQYFYVRGFLVDTTTGRPLCTVYESPNYTTEMQEFFAKTTDDFDADKVLNLDADTTNNFVVCADDVKVIAKSMDDVTNHVSTFDEINNEYIIQNADDQITSLQPGDIFAYEWKDGDFLILKVATIQVDDTTVTITGEDTSTEDVFDYIKIDASSTLEEATVDTSACSEGVTYNGKVPYSEGSTVDTEGIMNSEAEGSDEIGVSFSFTGVKIGNDSANASISGKFEASLKNSFKFYKTFSYTYVELKIEYSAKVTMSVSGKVAGEIEIANVTFTPAPGVVVKLPIALAIELSAKLDFSAKISGSFGMSVSSDEGIRNISSAPKLVAEIKGEVSLFIGLVVKPRTALFSDVIAYLGINGKLGGEVKGTTVKISSNQNDNEKHECALCIEGVINAKCSMEFEAKIFNCDRLKFANKFFDQTFKIYDWYYSFDHGTWALTTCPYRTYKVTVTVVDANGNPVSEASVNNGKNSFFTNSDGRVSFYLPKGEQKLTAKKEGVGNCYYVVTVMNQAKSLKMILNSGGNNDAQEVKAQINRIGLGYCRRAAIASDGALYMWGGNAHGEIGDGTREDKYSPVKIMDNVAMVGNLGEYHSGAITANRDLYMWGGNSEGQIGDGTTEDRLTPTKVMSNVASVSLGHAHSAAVTTDGDLYMWGSCAYGQLGLDRSGIVKTPTKIMSKVSDVSVGVHHSAAITTDGNLYMWGDNSSGQLGIGTFGDRRHTPTKIMSNVASVSLGGYHSAAITTDGDLYMWGYNQEGQLGNGTRIPECIPQKILSNVAFVSLGFMHSAAITTNGDLYVWGRNGGSIGDGTTAHRYIPTKVMSNVVSVALGEAHGMALTTNGDLYTWGAGSVQLDGGTTQPSLIPVKVSLSNIQAESIDSKMDIEQTKVDTPTGTVSFTDLQPGKTYNFYVMKSQDVESPFSADNLFYISQGVSDNNGNLTMSYDTSITCENVDAFVVCMDTIDISDATVSIPDLSYNGEEQHVKVTVTKNGKMLQEGIDYELSGNYAAKDVGEYQVSIGGIGEYSGLLSATYKVVKGDKEDNSNESDNNKTDNNEPDDNITDKDPSGNTADNSNNKNEDSSTNDVPVGPDTWKEKSGVEGFVYRLYNVALCREADAPGLQKWVSELEKQNMTAAQVAQGFIFSEEFLNKNYNDTQFVKMLYRTMFGREADQGGLNGWLSDLENGMSREYVFHGFAESQEFTNLCDSYHVKRGSVKLSLYRDKNKGATGFIARLYTKMLGRKYEDKGLEYWCKEYLTGKQSIEQIATNGFLHSEELTNQNLSDEEFVTRMYETFLNREPEEAGLKDWVGRLQSGKTTRDKLVYGFTNSQEFGNIKAAYGLK